MSAFLFFFSFVLFFSPLLFPCVFLLFSISCCCLPTRTENSHHLAIRAAALDDVTVGDVGPCLGFARSYISLCVHKDQEPRQDIVDFIQVLFGQKIKKLNLFDFPNASSYDTYALVKGEYFTSLLIFFTFEQSIPFEHSLAVQQILCRAPVTSRPDISQYRS